MRRLPVIQSSGAPSTPAPRWHWLAVAVVLTVTGWILGALALLAAAPAMLPVLPAAARGVVLALALLGWLGLVAGLAAGLGAREGRLRPRDGGVAGLVAGVLLWLVAFLGGGLLTPAVAMGALLVLPVGALGGAVGARPRVDRKGPEH